MENSPWLWANEEVGCKSKKLKKSQEEWQKKNLLKWRRACGLSNTAAASSSNYKLKIKTAVAAEPSSVMWNCYM